MSPRSFATARECGRLSPLKFEHAGLRTMRLQPMIDWYAKVLQAEAPEEQHAYLRSDAFIRNSMGHPLDPEALVARVLGTAGAER